MKTLLFSILLLTNFNYAKVEKLPFSQVGLPTGAESKAYLRDATIQAWWRDREGFHFRAILNTPYSGGATDWQPWVDDKGSPWLRAMEDQWTAHFYQSNLWRQTNYASINDWSLLWNGQSSDQKVLVTQNFGVGVPTTKDGAIGDAEMIKALAIPKAGDNDPELKLPSLKPKNKPEDWWILFGVCGGCLLVIVLAAIFSRKGK